MSQEWGVYSTSDGGFVAAGDWSRTGAEATRAALIAQADPADRAEAADDLAPAALCMDHRDAEQRADACELCDDADDDEADDDTG
jgi:hypothetical protein